MTRVAVIARARECLDFPLDDSTTNIWVLFTEQLEHFAALVAAAEREECADICDQHSTCEGIAQKCAAAIRARGESK